MRRFVFAGALALAAGGQALAADLPPPMAPPPRAPATYVPAPVPIFSWSGIYIGLNGGYSFGTATPSGGGSSITANGFLIGGTLGGNYQFGNFVVGLEGDGDWSNLDGTSTTGGGTAEVKSTWLSTVRGRAGYAWDRVLFYGTAGGAFGNVQAGLQPTLTSATQAGWTAGAGVEAAFAPNWTAKVEYLYVDFAGLSVPGATVTLTENLVRAGVNYKFSW